MKKVRNLLISDSGDQMTGFLIVILIVVVVGAVFLTVYQGGITEIWNGIVNKMKSVFGI